nr:MAG TPA: hypothetical protein [Caudoviricetes sp.]
MKLYPLIYECEEEDRWTIRGHSLIDGITGNVLEEEYNMEDCPEDAIIGRGLHHLDSFIDGIKFGIEIAKQGYEGIEEVEGTE